jgi:hypothetical protein
VLIVAVAGAQFQAVHQVDPLALLVLAPVHVYPAYDYVGVRLLGLVEGDEGRRHSPVGQLSESERTDPML